MKNRVVIVCCMLLMLCLNLVAYGQTKSKTRISQIKAEGTGTVAITLTSDKKFIYGGNRYVLHIGNKVFMRSRQFFENGKGTLIFLVPKAEFDGLEEGKNCYLTYGNMEEGEYEMEELAKQEFPTCWTLGKFSKHPTNK